MARTQYTVTFPAAKAGDQVTWPTTVKVYADKDAQVPLQPGQSLNEALTFSGWSDAASVAFSRRKTDGTTETVTVTSGAPTGTGAAVPTTNAASVLALTHKAADYAAVNGDAVLMSATTAVCTVTAPVPAANAMFLVKKIDTSNNAVLVVPNAAELIDGGSGTSVDATNAVRVFMCDGTDWWVV